MVIAIVMMACDIVVENIDVEGFEAFIEEIFSGGCFFGGLMEDFRCWMLFASL